MAIDRYTSVLTGDGDSTVFSVDSSEALQGFGVVAFAIVGTWSGVTATVKMCVNPTASPQKWAPITNAAFTSDVGDSLDMPVGAHFKVTVSGSGSPLPSLTCTFAGYIDKVA